MKKGLISLVFSLLFIFNGQVKANFITDATYQPYIGTDFHYRYLPLSEAFGGNVFAKHYKQATFLIGSRINDNLGIELGYHSTVPETKRTVGEKNSKVLGQHISQTPHHYLSRSTIDGYYLKLIGYYPLFEIVGNNVEALGYIGASNMRIRYRNILMKAGAYPQDINTNTITFNKNKLLLKAGAGFQYNYCHSAIRFLVNYENTSALKDLSSDRKDKSYSLKLKDSVSFGIGIILYML